jgi:hypothetical protein
VDEDEDEGSGGEEVEGGAELLVLVLERRVWRWRRLTVEGGGRWRRSGEIILIIQSGLRDFVTVRYQLRKSSRRSLKE